MTIATVTAAIPAGRWELDPQHTTLEFRVRHAGLARVRGVFQIVDGVIEAAPDGTLSGYASIDAASLTTGLELRDEHLRSADFFDVERHPTLTFATTAVQVRPDGRATVRGELAIRGVTRELELDGEVLGAGRDDEGAERIGIELTGRLDRRDYGLTWNAAVDGGGLLVGNRVDIALEISAVRS
jgi:polyisoprenoid-binding protein YceI